VREIIYLVADRRGVSRMTKNMPSLNRGEIPIKLVLEIEDTAYREPVIEKHVHVEDWRQGVDIADVQFKETIITEEEAELIRQRRLEKMQEVLEEQGYVVTRKDEPAVEETEARPA
jgi:hypothetical protein